MFIGAWDIISPNITEIARKFVKSRPFCKTNGHGLDCDILLLVTVCCYY